MKTILTVDGFDIQFEALTEETPVESMLSFEKCGCDHSSTIRAVNNGEYEYFMARVVAVKNGIELAEDILGGCIYETEEEFYNDKSGYFADMTSTVVAEAKETIKQLCVVAD
jgi:hypothetical protein